MGLFREAGRQVEQLKQSVTESVEDGETAGDAESGDGEGSDDDVDFECESCGARFDTHDGECPECWSTEIAQRAE